MRGLGSNGRAVCERVVFDLNPLRESSPFGVCMGLGACAKRIVFMRCGPLPTGGVASILRAMHTCPHTTEIVAAQRVNAEVAVFDLMGLDGPLPPYEPGAHIDVATPHGLRQYSLCQPYAPGQPYRIAVKHEVTGRGGSTWLHHQAQVGTRLAIGQPRNQFALVSPSKRQVLMAGGIGITPLFAMAQALWRDGAPFVFAYFCRSRSSAAFVSELLAAPWAHQVRWHFDDDPHTQLDLLAHCRQQPAGAHFYSCGPTGFMGAVRQAVADRDARFLHEERFVAEVREAGGLQTYEVTLARSAQVVRVAAPQTLLAALRACGVEPFTSCESGICGSCVTAVLGGTPTHGDSCLSDTERQTQMALCCGGSASPHLVLDL